MTLRRYTDAAGGRWRVWEVRTGAALSIEAHTARRHTPVGAALANGWLVFESETTGERRQLAPTPQDWLACSEAELWHLCRAARPVSGGAEPASRPAAPRRW